MTTSIEEGAAYEAWRRQVARGLVEQIDTALDSDMLAMPEEKSPVDEALTGDHGRQSFAAGQDVRETPEFQEHDCWRMLYIWPPDVDGPERVKCSGCGAAGRIEWEYKP